MLFQRYCGKEEEHAADLAANSCRKIILCRRTTAWTRIRWLLFIETILNWLTKNTLSRAFLLRECAFCALHTIYTRLETQFSFLLSLSFPLTKMSTLWASSRLCHWKGREVWEREREIMKKWEREETAGRPCQISLSLSLCLSYPLYIIEYIEGQLFYTQQMHSSLSFSLHSKWSL